jgi:hypothetical protein
MLDLSRLCDAYGKMIGGGFKHCPNAKFTSAVNAGLT